MAILSTYQRTVDPFKQGIHLGLTFGFGIGIVRKDNIITRVAAGTVILTDDTTNYIEVSDLGVISANITGYTAGSIPLYTVVTVSSAISNIQDDRCFFNVGGGGSGLTAYKGLICLTSATITDMEYPL